MESDLLLEIGAFSRRVGVSPELLRAWERRYGLLRPVRNGTGRRLYGRRDEQRVRAMSRALARGLRAGDAARAALRAAADEPAEFAEVRRRLRGALDALDDGAAQEQLDHLFGGYAVDNVLSEVILPYLHELGERWSCGEIGVGHEHFASTLLHGRLLSLARDWDTGSGPRAVLACPSGELHTIGLLCFGTSLRAYGWRVTFLGGDTPVEAVAQVAAALEPERIVLSSVRPAVYHRLRKPLSNLASRYPLALGGAGAKPELAERLGAMALEGDPVAEAANVAGSLAVLS